MKAHNRRRPCKQLHFRAIIKPHTDVSLGDCSYLDTCRHMKYSCFWGLESAAYLHVNSCSFLWQDL